MARYIDADAAIEYLEIHKELCKKNHSILCADQDSIIKFLQEKCPTADVVEARAIEQIKWERDMAIKQLESYGVGFLEEADVVKIVRCKDCKYWVSPMKDDAHYCNKKSGLVGIVAEEDFCSYGERRYER